MRKTDRTYLLCVARSLGACQLVEFELKFYIARALELVDKCVAGRVPFRMRGDDYLDASLERLVDMFKRLSDCPDLVRRLREFKDERNFLAHKAIVKCMDPDGVLTDKKAVALRGRLGTIEKEAVLLTEAIRDEYAKFIEHFY